MGLNYELKLSRREKSERGGEGEYISLASREAELRREGGPPSGSAGEGGGSLYQQARRELKLPL